MKRTIAWIAVAACAGCHGAGPSASVGDAPTLALVGEKEIHCGAVALTPSLAVTANHCVKAQTVSYIARAVDGHSQRTGLGVVVWRDPASDLAAFSGEGFVPAQLSRVPPEFERPSTVVAHVPAPWTNVQVEPREMAAGFLITSRLETGMSGSGIWDADGSLAGVAVGNDAHFGYFAGVGRVSKLFTQLAGVTPPVAAPDRRPPAVWKDDELTLDELLAATRTHGGRIGADLDRWSKTLPQ